MRYRYSPSYKNCRLCGGLYAGVKHDNQPGFCCEWCRVTFHRLCDNLLRILEMKGSHQAKARNKSRAKRQKKSGIVLDEQ